MSSDKGVPCYKINDYVSIESILLNIVDELETKFEQNSHITGLDTGFNELDTLLSGFHPGELIVVNGYPSMGTTTFCKNILEHVALCSNKQVVLFSGDATPESIAMRMISAIGNINQDRIRTGKLEGDEWSRLTTAVSVLSKAPINIVSHHFLSAEFIRHQIRDLLGEGIRLELVIIDKLQSMQRHSGDERLSPSSQVLFHHIKNIALDYDIPIIVISESSNNTVKQRPYWLEDTTSCRNIEGWPVDTSIAIDREEYGEFRMDLAKIHVLKNRNGPVGSTELAFQSEFSKFVDANYGATLDE